MPNLLATISGIRDLSSEVRSFTLSAPGQPFADAEPGAHVDVHLGNGLTRQYSLWDWGDDGTWASIAVKKETDGRGGSAWMHDHLHLNGTVDLGGVRNNFHLDEDFNGHVLIAGGIGVTPLIPMARRLTALGRDFNFYYLTRSRELAAFSSILEGIVPADALHEHRDADAGLFDLAAALNHAAPSGRVYVCGPEPLLQAVLGMTADWTPGRVCFERFTATLPASDGPSSGFEVILAKSDRAIHVAEDQSILDALLDQGIDVDYGCTEGICGACTTHVLEGDVVHRDGTKSATAHDADKTMCLCVSRAKGERLILDL